MLRPLADGLWDTQTRLRMVGVPVSSRTTVIQLPDGGLVIHSPGRLEPTLREELENLGPVRAIIAPNRFHHLFVSDWLTVYADAECHVAPRLVQKRRDLSDARRLGDQAHPTWSGTLEQHVVRGLPTLGEVVFFHPASKTLIATDTLHNIRTEPNLFARTLWRAVGGFGKFGPTALERILNRDRGALRASIERILDWDFDRVIVAHGDVLESGGKQGIRSGYAWALG